jgi:F-type H+/Na+-transporting ATPase subunit alpha
MQIRPEEITQILKTQLIDFEKKIDVSETGTVVSVGDGVAKVYGLEKAMAGELVDFGGGVSGMILNLEEESVGIAILGDDTQVKEGSTVKRTNKIVQVPVGEALLGRVVNALGVPIDGKGDLHTKHFRKVEIKAPGIVDRQSVKEPLQTGIKAIDAMIPIGRGQRELIIGDRQTIKKVVAYFVSTSLSGRSNQRSPRLWINCAQMVLSSIRLLSQRLHLSKHHFSSSLLTQG